MRLMNHKLIFTKIVCATSLFLASEVFAANGDETMAIITGVACFVVGILALIEAFK